MWSPSEEEAAFAEAVDDLLSERGAVESARAAADDPASWNAALWNELAQMGAADLVADDEIGAAICVADALGRRPAAVPALSTAIYAPALAASAGIELPADTVWSIGPFGDDGRVVEPDLRIAADGSAHGVLRLMLAAAWADAALIVQPGTGSVHRLDLRQEGITVHPRISLDPTLPFADVIVDGAATTQIASVDPAVLATALSDADRISSLWIAATSIGTAQRLLDLAVEYAGQRVQFGMRIGERQAIKHKCADMLMKVESARSALWNAVGARDGADAAAALALLRLASSHTVEFVAQQAFQVHGGIGFTWEHDLQFLFKRALVARQLFGTEEQHRDQILHTLSEKP